jgi:hypothetical protein
MTTPGPISVYRPMRTAGPIVTSPFGHLLLEGLPAPLVPEVERLGGDPHLLVGVVRGSHQPGHRGEPALEHVDHRVHVVLDVAQVADPPDRVGVHRVSLGDHPREEVLAEVQSGAAQLGHLDAGGRFPKDPRLDQVEPGVREQW